MKFAEAAAKDRELRGDAVLSHKEQLTKDVEEAVGVLPKGQVLIPVLTPTLGAISMWWHLTQIDLMYPMNVGKQPITTLDAVGGEVGEMRNRLVAMCLAIEDSSQGKTTIPWVFWCDDDVIIDRWALSCLCSHNRDIASGVYFCKGEFGEPLIFPGPSSGVIPFRPDEIFEAWGYAQGLSVVKLDVYRRMKEELELGVDKYGQPQWYKRPDFALTENGIISGGTEDFHFFDNACKLGYRPLVDCRRAAFGFHYDLKKHVAYPLKQWEQYRRKEPIVWPASGDRKEVVW